MHPVPKRYQAAGSQIRRAGQTSPPRPKAAFARKGHSAASFKPRTSCFANFVFRACGATLAELRSHRRVAPAELREDQWKNAPESPDENGRETGAGRTSALGGRHLRGARAPRAARLEAAPRAGRVPRQSQAAAGRRDHRRPRRPGLRGPGERVALPGRPGSPPGGGQQRHAGDGGDPGRPVRDGPLLPHLRTGHARLGVAQGPADLRARPAPSAGRAAGGVDAGHLAGGDLGGTSGGRRDPLVLVAVAARRSGPRHGPDVVRRGPAHLLARLRSLALLASASGGRSPIASPRRIEALRCPRGPSSPSPPRSRWRPSSCVQSFQPPAARLANPTSGSGRSSW